MIRVTIERHGEPDKSRVLHPTQKQLTRNTVVLRRRVDEAKLAKIRQAFTNERALSTLIERRVMPLSNIKWVYTLTIKRGYRDKSPEVKTVSYRNSPPTAVQPVSSSRVRVRRRATTRPT